MQDSLIQNSEISNLNPIFVPEPVQFEPVTIGWYILATILLLLAIFITYRVIKKWRENSYRRLAIKQLKKINVSLIPTDNCYKAIQQISILLKRVALKSYPRKSVASLYGNEWITFLTKKSKRIKFHPSTTKIITESVYKSSGSAEDVNREELNDFVTDVKKWIGGHRV